jgi:hypothetical protein
MGLPRVGTRPFGESFWTRREVCSNALGGIVVDVGGELIEGDIFRAFFGGGSLVVVEEEVM